MTDKSPPPPPPDSKTPAPAKPTANKPTYISGGNLLESPPLTARLTRFADDAYNFLGLYFVSLFSMDPYTAAQNSNFNTRGPGRVSNQGRARWGAGVGGGNAGAGGGGAGAGAGNGGRRLGTVDDVRGPECGSCG